MESPFLRTIAQLLRTVQHGSFCVWLLRLNQQRHSIALVLGQRNCIVKTWLCRQNNVGHVARHNISGTLRRTHIQMLRASDFCISSRE